MRKLIKKIRNHYNQEKWNFIVDYFDPASGLKIIVYNSEYLKMLDEDLTEIWSRRLINLEKVSIKAYEYWSIKCIDVIMKNGNMVLSSTGYPLIVNGIQNRYPEYPAPTIFSMEIKNGCSVFHITIEKGNFEAVQLYDEYGHLLYYGHDDNFEINVYGHDKRFFQLKSHSDIKIKNLSIISQINQQKLIIVGDSTAANHIDYVTKGYGQVLASKLKIPLVNLAYPGRSLRSFTDEKRFELMYDALNKEDIVLFAFGHNDEKRNYFGCNPVKFCHQLQDHKKMIEKKEVKLFIITPLSRRCILNQKFVNTHFDYQQIIINHFKKEQIIDLTGYSLGLLRNLGAEKSKDIYVHSIILEIMDNTHLSLLGADVISDYLLNVLNEKQLFIK